MKKHAIPILTILLMVIGAVFLGRMVLFHLKVMEKYREGSTVEKPVVHDVYAPPDHEIYRSFSAEEQLRKNGFVVSLEEDRQIFEPYLQGRLPVFVTVDSAYYVFQVLFQKCLKYIEFRNSVRLKRFVSEMHARLAEITVDGNALKRRARATCLAVFEVAGALLGETLPSRSGLERRVAEEVQKIGAAKAVAYCSILERKINYVSMKPDSFYTGMELLKQYYRVWRWLDASKFRSEREDEIAAALLLLDAFQRSERAQELWKSLNEDWSYFIGPFDDLAFPEYLEAWRQISSSSPSEASQKELREFKSILKGMRQPLIRSGYHDSVYPKQGFVLLGSRYLPESELFWKTVDPFVPHRVRNTGLEFAALIDEKRPLALMQASALLGTTITNTVKTIRTREVGAFYKEMLDSMQQMIATSGEDGTSSLPFIKTQAWQDKTINSILAYWALYRRLFTLHAKISNAYLGGHARPRVVGFIEPCPRMFTFLADNAERLQRSIESPLDADEKELLSSMTKRWISMLDASEPQGAGKENPEVNRLQAADNLKTFGRDSYRPLRSALFRFQDVMKKIAYGAEKQIAVEQKKEYDIKNYDVARAINGYGETLKECCFYFSSDHTFDDTMPRISVVAQYQETGELLHAGIGRANRLYVLFPWEGTLVPCVGGVLSYREFACPIDKKLNDSEWRAVADAMAGRPSWNQSFTTESVDHAILKKLAEDPEVKKRFLVQKPAASPQTNTPMEKEE